MNQLERFANKLRDKLKPQEKEVPKLSTDALIMFYTKQLETDNKKAGLRRIKKSPSVHGKIHQLAIIHLRTLEDLKELQILKSIIK